VFFLPQAREENMQESSYQQLIERMTQCEKLAKNAKDPDVRGKAAALVRGYRDLIAHADQLGHQRPAEPILEERGTGARPAGNVG
jgi:hypothetical protein